MRSIGVSSAVALALLLGMTAAGAQSDTQGKGGSERLSPVANRDGAETGGRVALSREQQGRISDAIRQANIKPVGDLDLSLVAGTIVPNSVQLLPVPDAIVAVLPQFRNYSFFVDGQQELVFVDPALKKIKARVPISSEASTPIRPPIEAAKTEGGSRDTNRAPNDTAKRARANTRPDTQSNTQADSRAEAQSGAGGASASRSAAHSKARATRDARESDTPSEDAPNRNVTQSDRPRGTVQNGFYRGRAARTETDVTVGSEGPEAVEVEGPPPVIRRVGPPVRPIRPVEPGPPPEPAPSRPPDGGPFGLLFGFFR